MNITLYKNIFAKICALLFAVFLWFFVMNEQNPPVESTFTVPLEVSNNLEGYSVDYNIENVKIKAPVRPGDQLIYEVKIEKARGPIVKGSGVAKVDGKVVTEASFTFSMV